MTREHGCARPLLLGPDADRSVLAELERGYETAALVITATAGRLDALEPGELAVFS